MSDDEAPLPPVAPAVQPGTDEAQAIEPPPDDARCRAALDALTRLGQRLGL